MDGIHDIGGTDGLGPVQIPEDEPIFHAEWEKAAFGIMFMCNRAGYFSLDQFRHAMEKIDPVVYLTSPYYEHWLYGYEGATIEAAGLDPQELDRRTQHYLDNPDEPMPDHEPDPELIDFINSYVRTSRPPERKRADRAARFVVGDLVTVKRGSPHGHTRRARYIRSCTGEVVAERGPVVYPDSAGNDSAEVLEHVYTVRFTGGELWGPEEAEPNSAVYIDVFDPYIEFATGGVAP